MPRILDPDTRRSLIERVRYYHELGIYDFYRRGPAPGQVEASSIQPEARGQMTPRKTMARPPIEENMFEVIATRAELKVSDPVEALRIIREDLGDCTRCVLHKQGRKQIVFGVGNPNAELMFVGEGPGADEDEQGEPFVGRAGQLLTRIIEAIGLRR